MTAVPEIFITAHDANRIHLYNLNSRAPLNDRNTHYTKDLGFTITDGNTRHVYTIKPGVNTSGFFSTPGEDRAYALAALAAYKAHANGIQGPFMITAADEVVSPSVAGRAQHYVNGFTPLEVLKKLSALWRVTSSSPNKPKTPQDTAEEDNPVIGYGILSYQKPLNAANIGAIGFYIRQNDKETIDTLTQWFSTMAHTYYQHNPDFGTRLTITYGDSEERIKQRFEDYQAFGSEMVFPVPVFFVRYCEGVIDELARVKREHDGTPVAEREKEGYDPLYELY